LRTIDSEFVMAVRNSSTCASSRMLPPPIHEAPVCASKTALACATDQTAAPPPRMRRHTPQPDQRRLICKTTHTLPTNVPAGLAGRRLRSRLQAPRSRQGRRLPPPAPRPPAARVRALRRPAPSPAAAARVRAAAAGRRRAAVAALGAGGHL
jgi:hypothetical protein